MCQKNIAQHIAMQAEYLAQRVLCRKCSKHIHFLLSQCILTVSDRVPGLWIKRERFGVKFGKKVELPRCPSPPSNHTSTFQDQESFQRWTMSAVFRALRKQPPLLLSVSTITPTNRRNTWPQPERKLLE